MKKFISSTQSGIALVPIIVIAVAVLAAGGGAAYYFTDGFGTNKSSSENKTADKSKEAPVAEDQTNESATGKDTLPLVKQALAGGPSIKCVAESKGEDGKHYIATEYIKDKDHIRMEIRSDMGTLNVLMLNRTDSYTWSEGNDRGTRSPLDVDDRSIEEQWQENIDDFNDPNIPEADRPHLSCGQAAVDDALFKVPKGVTFSDLGKFID